MEYGGNPSVISGGNVMVQGGGTTAREYSIWLLTPKGSMNCSAMPEMVPSVKKKGEAYKKLQANAEKGLLVEQTRESGEQQQQQQQQQQPQQQQTVTTNSAYKCGNGHKEKIAEAGCLASGLYARSTIVLSRMAGSKEATRAMHAQRELIDKVEMDKSFVDVRLSHLLDIKPAKLNTSYEVELADGKVVCTNTVLKGCTLNLLNHLFDIDLMPIELGTFDVIIGMDWLVERDAIIVCGKYIVKRDPVVLSSSDRERTVKETGLPPSRQVEFRIDLSLCRCCTFVAAVAPTVLAPSGIERIIRIN
ncbi:putative reverse transcriptase domain-containing protein [Tanacetum coccineum]|uniref:Reverse transcriptase domain-containing protein n=1 Tax=Tanacetum coccineum TaxID=301880 RepID=A0ABQ4YCD2_9ASTR